MQQSGAGFVVGIDAGGTSVRVYAADAATGAVRAEAQGAADTDGGPEPLAALLHAALEQAQARPDDARAVCAVCAVCAGITKITRAGVEARWRAELARLFPQVPEAARAVVPDYVIAFHGAVPSGVGLAVVAGTGSVVYGEDGRGGAVRVGGRGWEYGDEGSGAWLTAEMVRRTLRALDGLERPTPLTQAVCGELQTTDPARLGEAARQRAQAEGRGFLAPLALDRARAGDREAVNLFVGAGGWLAAYAKAAAGRLQLPEDSPVQVAAIGGMWEAGDLLLAPFGDVLRRSLPRAVVAPPDAAPVVGAVRLACRATPPDPR